MKKRQVFLLLMFIVIIVVVCFCIKKQKSISNNMNKEVINNQKLTVQDLYKYGERIEQMDISPNTIVAKFNGEEILFHEIESQRISINNTLEDGNVDDNEKSAFYEVLKNELYCDLAIKYSDASDVSLDSAHQTIVRLKNEWINGTDDDSVEEYRNELLSVLCIEENEIWLSEEDFIIYLQDIFSRMYLSNKGIDILWDFMLEKPELAEDKELENKVEQIKNIQGKQKELVDAGKREEAIEFTSELAKLLKEVREIYTQDLILNAEIELCVDKNELSYEVPILYYEINEKIDSLDKKVFLTDVENYNFGSTEIKISEEKAKEIAQKGFEESAKRIAGKGADNKESEKIELKIVSPNNYFTRTYYESNKIYTEIKRQCYIVNRENEMGNGISIYVDATTGLIIGGEAYGD